MTKNSISIEIVGLKISLRVGVYDWEKNRPRPLRVSIKAQLSHAESGRSDNVSDTLDYDVVASLIQEYSATAEHDLLESYAKVIADKILEHCKIVSAIEVKIEKPGALKSAENVAIIYKIER